MNITLKRRHKIEAPAPAGVPALVLTEYELEERRIDSHIGAWFRFDEQVISWAQQKPGSDEIEAWFPSQHDITDDLDICTPSDLYDALHWDLEVQGVYGLPQDLLRKLAITTLITVIAIGLGFAFLIFVSLIG